MPPRYPAPMAVTLPTVTPLSPFTCTKASCHGPHGAGAALWRPTCPGPLFPFPAAGTQVSAASRLRVPGKISRVFKVLRVSRHGLLKAHFSR